MAPYLSPTSVAPTYFPLACQQHTAEADIDALFMHLPVGITAPVSLRHSLEDDIPAATHTEECTTHGAELSAEQDSPALFWLLDTPGDALPEAAHACLSEEQAPAAIPTVAMPTEDADDKLYFDAHDPWGLRLEFLDQASPLMTITSPDGTITTVCFDDERSLPEEAMRIPACAC